MSVKVRYFSLAGVAVLLTVFISAAGYSGAVYLGDCAKSVVIRAFGLYSYKGAGVTIISADRYRPRTETYKRLPAGFFHFGSTLFYRAQKNIRVADLAPVMIEYTDLYRLSDLNGLLYSSNRITGGIINSGELIVVPRSLPYYIHDVISTRSSEVRFIRGLYFSGDRTGENRFLSQLPYLKSLGINAIVFDVKDITGIVHIKNISVKEVRDLGLSRKGGIDNLPMLIRECRKNGIYMIARISVFRDHLLYEVDPSSRIKSVKTGGYWNHGTKEMWCDPTNRRVQDYNIALVEEVASAGVDEIQLDYLRFPTNGDQADALFAWSGGKKERSSVIGDFLKRVHERVAANGAFLSIDIFGVTAWGKDVDIKKLGQQIDVLAANCDVISPMLYPSHFNDDFDGYARPGDNPYHFISSGCRKVKELAGRDIKVRPWLQAFQWRVSSFNADYILEQVRAANDSGALGYLFWNASNRYDEVYRAMEKIKK